MERTRVSMTILANKLPFLYPCQIIETMMIVNGLHICHGSAAPRSPLFPSSFSFFHPRDQIPKQKYTNTKTQSTNTNPIPHPRDHQVDLIAVPNAQAQIHKYPNINTQIHKYQNIIYKYKPLPAPTRLPGGSESKLQKPQILRNRL